MGLSLKYFYALENNFSNLEYIFLIRSILFGRIEILFKKSHCGIRFIRF